MKYIPNARIGFTLVELLAILAIVAVLIAILFPVVASSRRRAQETACLSNVRQWSSSVMAYAQDYDGTYPTVLTGTFAGDQTTGYRRVSSDVGISWHNAVRSYEKIFLRCPSRTVSEDHQHALYNSGYALNSGLNTEHKDEETNYYTGDSESAQQYQSTVVTVFDARPGIIASATPDSSVFAVGLFPSATRDEINALKPAAFRHDGGANYAFADGHVKWLRNTAFRYRCDGAHPCFKP